MNIHLEQKVATRGYFSINVLDAEGNDTGKGVTDSPNVVTHIGGRMTRQLDWGNPGTGKMESAVTLGVGTGTVERTVDSTDLANEVAVDRGTVENGSGTGFTDNLDGTETYKKVCVGSYPLGAISETLSEVGIFTGTTGSNLIAGQLIKDGAGNPTTITVLGDEQLVVTYTIEWTYSVDTQPQATGTVDVNGTSTTWTLTVPPVRTNGLFNYPDRTSYIFDYVDTDLLVAGDGTIINSKDIGTQLMETISTGGQRYTLGNTWAPSEGAGDVAKIILATEGERTTLSDVHTIASLEFDPAIPKTSAEVLIVEVSWDLVAV